MEIHKDLVVGREFELITELKANHDKQDRFIKYKDARCGYVYAWFDVECKEYVIFIAQETDSHTNIAGFTLHDNRNGWHNILPHTVVFIKSGKKTFLDLTGANPDKTQDNIDDFISSFEKETEVDGQTSTT